MKTNPPAASGGLYRIAWTNKTETCRTGKGTKQMPLEVAEALCKELNEEYPYIEHRIEPV